jgi:hypothetical protein
VLNASPRSSNKNAYDVGQNGLLDRPRMVPF